MYHRFEPEGCRLAPYFVGPLNVLEHICEVAYKLDYKHSLHVSCAFDEPLPFRWRGLATSPLQDYR